MRKSFGIAFVLVAVGCGDGNDPASGGAGGGSCKSSGATNLATASGFAFATNSTHVFFAVEGANLGELVIRRVPVTGGPPDDVAAGKFGTLVTAFAADADRVYWSSGGMWTAPAGGGEATKLSDDSAGLYGRIAVQGSDVFFTSNGGLRKVPREGGPVVSLSPRGQYSLVVDSTHVFFAEPGEGSHTTISRIPVAGGIVDTLASDSEVGQSMLDILGADEQNVYLGVSHLSTGAVFRVAKTGGTLTKIAEQAGSIVSLAQDGGTVFYAVGQAGDAAILRSAPAVGGAYRDLYCANNMYSIRVAGGSLIFNSVGAGTTAILTLPLAAP